MLARRGMLKQILHSFSKGQRRLLQMGKQDLYLDNFLSYMVGWVEVLAILPLEGMEVAVGLTPPALAAGVVEEA
jgi:hypothetical protein